MTPSPVRRTCTRTHKAKGRQTRRKADRQDGQDETQTDGQPKRKDKADTQSREIQTDGQQPGGKTGKLTDKQTDRQTDRRAVGRKVCCVTEYVARNVDKPKRQRETTRFSTLSSHDMMENDRSVTFDLLSLTPPCVGRGGRMPSAGRLTKTVTLCL